MVLKSGKLTCWGRLAVEIPLFTKGFILYILSVVFSPDFWTINSFNLFPHAWESMPYEGMMVVYPFPGRVQEHGGAAPIY